MKQVNCMIANVARIYAVREFSSICPATGCNFTDFILKLQTVILSHGLNKAER